MSAFYDAYSLKLKTKPLLWMGKTAAIPMDKDTQRFLFLFTGQMQEKRCFMQVDGK